jgi:hypothetical protein
MKTKPYSQRFWNVTETRIRDGVIVRQEKNLNTYSAEDMYSQLSNTNPVRQRIHHLVMTEVLI